MQNPIVTTIERGKAAAAQSWLPDQLVSADSHVTEPPHCYSKYIDPKFRDRAPKVVTNGEGGSSFALDGMDAPIPLGIIAAAGINPREMKMGAAQFEELHRGGWDGKARIADQDRDGISAEVIYPSVGMVLCNIEDLDYKRACMWAYNRWLHEEFCAAAPDRLIGLGQTAVRSVAEAIDDFQKIKEMGFKGVMMPGTPGTEEEYDHPSFDPLWRAAVDLELPISFHLATSRADGGKKAFSVEDRPIRGPKQNTLNLMFKSIQDIIGVFIWGRIFERHPKLKLVCVESDAGWAPHFVYRMDHQYNRHRFWQKVGDMKRPPSEYFAENVYLTFQDDLVAFQLAHAVNPNRLLWANDFPHSDATWPWSRDLLRVLTYNVDNPTKTRIVRDNTAELYNIKLGAMARA
jgi:predicted TIM-barrel fold metal-dependent hydrolase